MYIGKRLIYEWYLGADWYGDENRNVLEERAYLLRFVLNKIMENTHQNLTVLGPDPYVPVRRISQHTPRVDFTEYGDAIFQLAAGAGWPGLNEANMPGIAKGDLRLQIIDLKVEGCPTVAGEHLAIRTCNEVFAPVLERCIWVNAASVEGDVRTLAGHDVHNRNIKFRLFTGADASWHAAKQSMMKPITKNGGL